MIYEVTCTAPVNIAVIKYWGKRNVTLMLPTNASLSLTLSQDQLHSKTSIRLDSHFDKDRFWLNGIEEELNESKKFTQVIHLLRQRRAHLETSNPHLPSLSNLKLHVVSENNFPTAAGLASSASGYAALVFSLAQVFELPLSLTDLSMYARLGSGSACRSMLGGFVVWEKGNMESGQDSIAHSLKPASYWPLDVLILVVQDTKKTIASTQGMQSTVATSTLASTRFESIVPSRLNQMQEAIVNQDFNTFAQLTMQDSNQFHALCLDTYPPIFYLNDVSKSIIQWVHEWNHLDLSSPLSSSSSSSSSTTTTPTTTTPPTLKAAYTFDAGPNAVIFTLPQYTPALIKALLTSFPKPADIPMESYFNDPYHIVTPSTTSSSSSSSTPIPSNVSPVDGSHLSPPPSRSNPTTVLSSHPHGNISPKPLPVYAPGCIKRILHVKVGDGPKLLFKGPSEDSLINKDGFPHRIRD